MKLFNKKNKEEKEEKKEKSPAKTKSAIKDETAKNFVLIKNPRITEKSTILSEKSVYVFDVTERATKPEIRKEFEKAYSIKPVKVRIVNTPGKATYWMRKRGTTGGGKKAYVYLPEGKKIEIKS